MKTRSLANFPELDLGDIAFLLQCAAFEPVTKTRWYALSSDGHYAKETRLARLRKLGLIETARGAIRGEQNRFVGGTVEYRLTPAARARL